MNYINKALLTAALGSSLLALEACRKWDTNRLSGQWKMIGGDNFSSSQEIIFDFKKDGDFTEQQIITGITDTVFTYTFVGEWEWALGKKIEIRFDESFGYNIYREFDVLLIQGKEMELRDAYDDLWIFVKEE